MTSGGAGRRILLCEDDPDLREELADTLADGGHQVVTSMDGWDALHQMRVNRPDLVVLDLLMPVMTGWQFRAEQKRDPALADIPVVVISGSESAAAVAVDADLYIRKPLTPDTLLRAIDDVLAARERMMEPARAAQSERMAALGTLAAGIAHEINNPLTYVLLQLETASRRLRDRAAASLPDPAAELRQIAGLVESALEGTLRIRDVAAGVRAFARGDDQTRVLLDVRAVIDGSIRLIANELRHRATLVRDYQEVPAVLGNESRLGQVFLNLLTNAMHAIPEGAASAHQIRVSTRTDESGAAVVEVSDTGAGIPEHILGHIFEPFFTTKQVGHGTGLGLSISHGIVRSYGGEISVVRRDQGATTFRVRLPAGPRRGRAATEEAVPVGPLSRRRILVVDDEASVCRALRDALAGEHEVVSCMSGLHALSTLAGDPSFDLVLCDLHIPEMTGMGFYKRLVRSNPDLASRVVFMTAGTFTDEGRQFLEGAPRDVVEKPLDMAQLRGILARS